MKNANIESSQRVSLLASIALHSTEILDAEGLQNADKYDKVASISRSSDPLTSIANRSMSAHSGTIGHTRTTGQVADWKRNSTCNECAGKDHLHKDSECTKIRKDTEYNRQSSVYVKCNTIRFD